MRTNNKMIAAELEAKISLFVTGSGGSSLLNFCAPLKVMQTLLGYSEKGAALKGRPHNAHMIFTFTSGIKPTIGLQLNATKYYLGKSEQ